MSVPASEHQVLLTQLQCDLPKVPPSLYEKLAAAFVDAVAKAKPDGQTITFGNNQTHGNNMFMLKEPGYDAVKDFAPLAGAGAFEHVFVVKNDLPAKTIQEVIALAKAKPGELNYGSTGIGSGSHLSTELFMARTGIKMTHVPYRNTPQSILDIASGHVHLGFVEAGAGLPLIKDGKLRALAVSSATRLPVLPEAPPAPRTIAAFAAGSGITPLLSIAAAALEGEPETRVTLIIGNRTAEATRDPQGALTRQLNRVFDQLGRLVDATDAGGRFDVRS